MSNKRIQFRSLTPLEEHSTHYLAALQIIAHAVAPLRKALVHLYLTCRGHALEKIEWKTLQAIGKLLKELIAAPAENSSVKSDDSDDDDDEPDSVPVDPLEMYSFLEPCLKEFGKTCAPKDATEALRVLLETIQQCARTLPLTSHLWVALLDTAGLGLMSKVSIVGKCPLIEDHQILQRTQKETCLEWCPLLLPKRDTLQDAFKEHCARKPYQYDFDKKPYQFEVRIPVLSPSQTANMDTSNWTTTRTLLYSSLTSYLFLAVDRWDRDGNLNEGEVVIPMRLDLAKMCQKECKGTKEYELVGGTLHDEGDYVALIRNETVEDPEDEEAWMLMEAEEIIPMSESDALDFLQGEDEDAPCGTVLVYRRCDDQQEMKQLLSDIIISQVSGTLDAEADFYYEEEVIEE